MHRDFKKGLEQGQRALSLGRDPEALLEELRASPDQYSPEEYRGMVEAIEEAIVAQALDEKPKALAPEDLPEPEAKILREFGQPTEEKNEMVKILVNGTFKTTGGHAVHAVEVAVRSMIDVIANCDKQGVGLPLDQMLGFAAQSLNDAANRFVELGRLGPPPEEGENGENSNPVS